jgi:SAM-dependent methyltransferase
VQTSLEQWEAVHRWHWFHRRQWQADFRDGKLPLARAVVALLGARGLAGGEVLDCACGLGLQAVTFKEAGLRVAGADRSAFAVEHARELARAEGHDIPFFVATWQELPRRTTRRYDAVFCDALPWLPARRDFAKALRSLHAVLRPGGVLFFLGAPAGMSGADYRRAVRAWWRARPRATLDWRHREGDLACSGMTLGELGPDFIDWHLLYLVEERGEARLERVTLRESKRWHWQRLVELCGEAGFSDLATVTHQAWSPGGMPAGLHVATR